VRHLIQHTGQPGLVVGDQLGVHRRQRHQVVPVQRARVDACQRSGQLRAGGHVGQPVRQSLLLSHRHTGILVCVFDTAKR